MVDLIKKVFAVNSYIFQRYNLFYQNFLKPVPLMLHFWRNQTFHSSHSPKGSGIGMDSEANKCQSFFHNYSGFYIFL